MANQSRSKVNGKPRESLLSRQRFLGSPQSRNGRITEQLDKIEALIQALSFKQAHEALLEIHRNQPLSSPSAEVYRFRTLMGHCLWELGRSSEALTELEEALRIFRTVHNTLVLPEEKDLPDFALEQLRQLREIELGILDAVNGSRPNRNGKEKKEILTRRIVEISSALNSINPLANIYRLLGSVNINLGKIDKASEHLTSAITGFKLSKDYAKAARALNQMAYLCIVQGHLKESLQYVEQSKEAALKSEDRYYAIVQDGVASVCHRLLGNWKLSIEDLNQFLIETKRAKDFFNYVTGLFGLGFAKVLGGRTNEARKNYFDALQVATDVGLIGSQKAGYEYLAQLSISEGRFAEAEDYLKKAMEIGERVSPYGTIMTQCWRLMGDLHNAKGEPQNALKAYETCESYLIKLPEELERGACFVGRGMAYAKLQQWKVSSDCFEKALDVFDQCENDWETAKAVVTAVEVGAYSAKQVTLQLLAAKELFQKLEHPAWEKRVENLLAQPEVGPVSPSSLRVEKLTFERERVLEALEKSGHNRTRAAELLGIPRTTLLSILRRFGINQ